MIRPTRWGRALRALWLLASLVCASGAVAARDVPLALLKSFEGNVNFAGTQATLLSKGNGAKSCDVAAASSVVTAQLNLPAFSNVLSAHLYWAGSGNPDNSVVFEGKTVTAPENRRYFSNTFGGGLDYFGAAVDVTSVVAAKRSGDYSFSGLTVANGKPYCEKNNSFVVGGFALVVVYSHWSEPFRTVNLYEGYQALQNGAVTLTLGNFRVPDVLDGATARAAHLVWEGDGNESQQGETFEFNGIAMTNAPYSTSGNPFNGKSSINSDGHSFAIDFDAYDVTGAIKPGQTSASMLFRTADDLVLLNAAVMAFPSMPRADLALEIGRSGPLHVGRGASYTLKVSNDGPDADSGPVTLTVTLPGQLNYVGVAGSGWSCPSAGLKLTCTYEGLLASQDQLPPLTVNVTVASTGTVNVDATVAGSHDPNMANNSVTDTAVVAEASSGGYVFTEGECKLGEQIGNSDACREVNGWFPGGAVKDIYITAVSTDSAGRAASATPPPAQLSFALACVNPGAGAGRLATYAGKNLPQCTRDGRAPASNTEWSEVVEVGFRTGSASSRQTFLYHDVGQLQLRLRDSAGRISASQAFVSRPSKLSLAIFRTVDGVGNPGTTDLGGAGFAAAGEKLTLKVSALLADGKTIAPNFGNEAALPAVRISTARHETFRKGEEFPESELPSLVSDSGTMNKLGSGVIGGGDFRWNEVGVVIMQALLDNYLGTQGGLDSAAATVGRFYPAYFTTTVATPFSCLTRMRCPDPNSARAVTGAAYSGQPFDVNVAAYAEGGVGPLKNFTGQWIPALRLRAFDAPGGDAGLDPSEKQGLQGASLPGAIAQANVSYLLPVRFDADAPRGPGWSAPAAIYIRAEAIDQRSGNDPAAAKPITISSLRSEPAASKEGGVMVVNGRLQPANVFSAPLLPTPVRLDAQYWTGSAWENNTVFDDPTALSGAVAQFWHCRRGLRVTPVAKRDNCDTGALVPMGRPLTLAGGTTRYWLKASKSGSAMLQMNLPVWLPSAYGQVVFGQYNSPVIYMRELY